jgi:sigma-54 specific flagellar transcriptional regulator A
MADPSLQPHIIGQLVEPPRYAQLLDLLHQCQVCRNNQHATRVGDRAVELFRSMVGNSRAIQEVRRLVEHVAQTDASVLILGETGTGKEVVARNLHFMSARKTKPFIPLNCGAIPAELLESELFGHEKGAFTGAVAARQGRFEMAQGGTLFLDEIGDMPMNLQVKLLRVLQERTFERVGGNKTISADVRIVAATHRNLERQVSDGKFREDLFYRLNVFPIEMPPMRERREDIPLLVNELISRLESQGSPAVRLSPNALVSLSRYEWPGNVRELANLIERLAILFPYGVVDVNELPAKYRHAEGLSISATPVFLTREDAEKASSHNSIAIPQEGLDLKEYIANLEIAYINQALNETGGVVARAADRLQMRRTTLVEKMRKYGMSKGEEVTEV